MTWKRFLRDGGRRTRRGDPLRSVSVHPVIHLRETVTYLSLSTPTRNTRLVTPPRRHLPRIHPAPPRHTPPHILQSKARDAHLLHRDSQAPPSTTVTHTLTGKAASTWVLSLSDLAPRDAAFPRLPLAGAQWTAYEGMQPLNLHGLQDIDFIRARGSRPDRKWPLAILQDLR